MSKMKLSSLKDRFNKFITAFVHFRRSYKLVRFGLTAFALYALFLDSNSFVKRFYYDMKIRELNKEIDYYRKEINVSKAKFNELNSSRDNLEKFAREQFLMKKKNEDIFLIEP